MAILTMAALVWAGQPTAQAGRGARMVTRAAAAAVKPITYGRWIVDTEGDWVEAWTDNESGSEFGLLCSSDCMIYLDFRVACEEGEDYPAMVNSGGGALAITMRCHHYEERQIFIAEATGDYIDMLQQDKEVGFAFPLKDGLFRVARFSTQGGYEAVVAAIRIAMKSGKLKAAPKDVSI
jgi:hypothetical protein